MEKMANKKYNHKVGEITHEHNKERYKTLTISISKHRRVSFRNSVSTCGRQIINGFARKSIPLKTCRLEMLLFFGKSLNKLIEESLARHRKNCNRHKHYIDPDMIDLNLDKEKENGS
jgi:hypothetical protein